MSSDKAKAQNWRFQTGIQRAF